MLVFFLSSHFAHDARSQEPKANKRPVVNHVLIRSVNRQNIHTSVHHAIFHANCKESKSLIAGIYYENISYSLRVAYFGNENYIVCIRSIGLYESETWTLGKKEESVLKEC